MGMKSFPNASPDGSPSLYISECPSQKLVKTFCTVCYFQVLSWAQNLYFSTMFGIHFRNDWSIPLEGMLLSAFFVTILLLVLVEMY